MRTSRSLVADLPLATSAAAFADAGAQASASAAQPRHRVPPGTQSLGTFDDRESLKRAAIDSVFLRLL